VRLRATLGQLRRWAVAQRAARAAAVDDVAAATLRRHAAARVASALEGTPREQRARAAREAGRLLHAVVGARGAGAEAAARECLEAAVLGRVVASVPSAARAATHEGAPAGRDAVDQVRVLVVVLLLLPEAPPP
jgi:hypothetical protein